MERPPDFVLREAAGLERFAEMMRNDGWDRERVLALPDVQLPYWYGQALAMEQILEDPATEPFLSQRTRILDVGSNTCWASAKFAERGLDVVALDIAAHELQGLRTGEWWFEAKDVYFERVQSVMFEPALASESFDVIWCCEVLHHNHRANLFRTMRELHRLLKPGGCVIIVNEPVRGVRSPKLHPGADVADFHGHEHAYRHRSYVTAARRAGFELEVIGPSQYRPITARTLGITMQMSSFEAFKVALAHVVRRHRLLRAAYLAWKTDVGAIPFYLMGHKSQGVESEQPRHATTQPTN